MTSRRQFIALVFAAAALPLTAARAAWAGSWVNLGSRKVRAYGEADRFVVSDNGGIYTKLRVAVSGNGVFIVAATVLFGNGETATYQFDALVEQGTVSGAIDLPGDGRAIVHVDMLYRRRRNGHGVAVVTLQGLTA